jgi:N4-gp56 family major capsid protein
VAQQSWASDSGANGFRTVVEISKKVVHAAQPMMKFRQFSSVEDAFGKNKGESVQIYRAGNTDEESESDAINELDRIPTLSVAVTPRLITVNEWGRAIPFTGKVETLAEVDVESNVYLKALRNHMAKTIDRQVAAAFKSSDIIAIPTSSTVITWDVDGTASTTATSNITAKTLKDIVDAMKTGIFGNNTGRPIPFYDGESYVCIASTTFLRGLKDDADYETAAKYAHPEDLYLGEVGRFYNVRFIESNHANALDGSVGTGGVLGEAVIFGEDPIREVVAIPEEIRSKLPEDYGRDKGLAWYAMLGWGRVWDFSTDGEEHIVRITSA